MHTHAGIRELDTDHGGVWTVKEVQKQAENDLAKEITVTANMPESMRDRERHNAINKTSTKDRN